MAAAPLLKSINPLDRRNRVSDFLMNFHFHVWDVSFSTPTVLTPVFGFRSVTTPEINVTTKNVKEGTFEYPRHIAQSAEVSPIELHQGARFFNSDFYDWVRQTVRGVSNMRKNLLIIHYSEIGVGNLPGTTPGGLDLGFTPITDLVSRIPARAWLCIDCIPIRYKAGTDFDSLGPDVSIMELTVQPWYVEEFNTGV